MAKVRLVIVEIEGATDAMLSLIGAAINTDAGVFRAQVIDPPAPPLSPSAVECVDSRPLPTYSEPPAPKVKWPAKAKRGMKAAKGKRVATPQPAPALKATEAKKPSAGYVSAGDGAAWVPPADTDTGCRAQVYRALQGGPKLSTELFAIVKPLTPASVQLALSELRLSGVVRSEQDGRDRIHYLMAGK